MNEYTNLDNSIFNISGKEEKEKRVPSASDTAVYTVSGSQDFVDQDGYPRLDDLSGKKAEDRHEAHAKSSPDGDKLKFFAKIGNMESFTILLECTQKAHLLETLSMLVAQSGYFGRLQKKYLIITFSS